VIVEGDHGEEVLVAQRAERSHVVADLAAKGRVRGERGAEQADGHRRAGRDAARGDDRTGAVDADPPIQDVPGDARA
jgi:hypothetical protein